MAVCEHPFRRNFLNRWHRFELSECCLVDIGDDDHYDDDSDLLLMMLMLLLLLLMIMTGFVQTLERPEIKML